MAEVFSLANALQAGDRLKQNEQNREFNTLRLSGERRRQDVEQRTLDAEQQRTNSEKTLFGVRLAIENINNPGILSAIGQELVSSGIFNEAELPQLLEQAKSNPEQALRGLAEDEAKLMFDLGEGPTFGAPVAGVGEGGPEFRRFAPGGESQTVEGFAPPAGGGISARGRFFGELTEGLSPEDEALSRRIQLGLDPRATGSAAITIAGDEELTEQVAESGAIIAQRKKFGEMTGASRAKTIDKSFEAIQNIDANLRNLDKAIAAIDEGASTGAIVSRFTPTVRAATVKLEQIRSELGLDVVGGVTFGALSKGELDLALTVALPTNLNPPELRQWLQDKQAAVRKLRAYYAEQIDFLDQGGSIAGFLRSKQRQLGEGQSNTQQLIQQARDAISQGADRNAVIQRLSEAGIDASGL